MSKRIKRILGIYILGALISSICSYLYLYYKTNLALLIIFVAVFIISYLMPLWFRLFLKTKPYYGKYRGQLLEFARKQGIFLNNIDIRESNRSNACSFGLWNNKVVTFNSLTLEKHPYEEIEGVMAHELGHHTNFGIYVYTIIVAVLLILLSLINFVIYSYVGTGGNLIQFFLICLITTALALPIVLMTSRYMEGLADKYALKILNDPSTLGRFLERMLKYEKEAGQTWPKNPTFLIRMFLTHPWIYDRIKLSKTKL